MAFELTYNHPVCNPHGKGEKRVGIVAGTNLTEKFFRGAGIGSLPENVTVFHGAGERHSSYTIEGAGPKLVIDATCPHAREKVGEALRQRGATPAPTGANGC